VISLLRLWTHNRPFSDFPQLSYNICDTVQPYCDIIQPHSDFAPTPGTTTHVMPHHLWHHRSNCTMCYTMLPTISPKTRISRDVTHYYIWYPDPEVQLQDGATLAPSPFSNFTDFMDFSCILPMFHNFIQLFPSIPLFLTCG
jgi:hypothetical protein